MTYLSLNDALKFIPFEVNARRSLNAGRSLNDAFKFK